MFHRILVPLDGSERARCAVPVAARIARASGGTVVLLRVVGLPLESSLTLIPSLPSASSQTMIEVEKIEARRYLREVAVSADLTNVHTELEVHCGQVATTITTIASAYMIDLIVLCRHGYTGATRWALGGVAEKVAHDTAVPLLLLHSDKKASLLRHKASLRAMVPLDGSMQAEMAIEPAAHLIAALSVPDQGILSLTQVIKLPPVLPIEHVKESQRMQHLQEQAVREVHSCFTLLIERLNRGIATTLRLAVIWSSLFGKDVAEALLDVTEQCDYVDGQLAPIYDVLVMTTHGRGGMQHGMIGSIVGRMLRTTNLSMLIVPQGQRNRHSQDHQARPVDVKEVMPNGQQLTIGASPSRL